ncbi:MAG: SRPBCC family protein [Chloroflexota bacterium]
MAEGITKTVTVRGKADEIYKIWENFENFPNFMNNIKSVTKTGDRTSHWVMGGPMGSDLEWDAITTDVNEGKWISWKSSQGDIGTHGHVSFSEQEDGNTIVSVRMHYDPPAGILGDAIAKLFANPEGTLEEDLQNFKRYAEAQLQKSSGGNVSTSAGTGIGATTTHTDVDTSTTGMGVSDAGLRTGTSGLGSITTGRGSMGTGIASQDDRDI